MQVTRSIGRLVGSVKSVIHTSKLNTTCQRAISTKARIFSPQPSFKATQIEDALTAPKLNKKARIELAAIYRIFDKLNLNEGVCNHLTLMAPAADGSGEVMLLVPGGRGWSEVNASCLIGLNTKGEVVEGNGTPEISASCIHLGARANVNHACVIHLHSPYVAALASLKKPELLMIHQNSMRFYKNIAYDDAFEGAASTMEEGKRLGNVLGNNDVMIMENHGLLAIGKSAAWGFDNAYYLERVAMFQILAMSTRKELRILPPHVCQSHREKYNAEVIEEYVNNHFRSVIRKLYKECPDFAE